MKWGIQEERTRENAFQKRKYSQSNIITLRLRPSNSPYLLSFRCSFLQGEEFGWRTSFQKISCYINNSKISSNSKSDVHVPWDITEVLFRRHLPETKENTSTEKVVYLCGTWEWGAKKARQWRLNPIPNHFIWSCPMTTPQKGKQIIAVQSVLWKLLPSRAFVLSFSSTFFRGLVRQLGLLRVLICLQQGNSEIGLKAGKGHIDLQMSWHYPLPQKGSSLGQ